ncbi:hypothetical protein ACFQGT_17710 [Natrialbaceae archaeon GCM10025810]|uniref:hypothetical protein n=1 Tax=Halovalidus salilacus TaxID=3075124 RepID=UPI0036094B80
MAATATAAGVTSVVGLLYGSRGRLRRSLVRRGLIGVPKQLPATEDDSDAGGLLPNKNNQYVNITGYGVIGFDEGIHSYGT